MVKHDTESLLKQYNVIACTFIFYHFKHQLTSLINLDMMEISLIFQSETQIVKKKKSNSTNYWQSIKTGVLCSGSVSLINHRGSRTILHVNIYPYVAL